MKLETAAGILAQLGNETRLRIVRHLVKAGEEGVTVGELQAHLGIPGSTLSHHINHLKHAGLVTQQREGTTLYCRMNYKTMESVMEFLNDKCCINAGTRRRAAS